MPSDLASDRLDSGLARAHRSRSLPLPWELRQVVLGALVLTRALYGCAVSSLPDKMGNKLRSTIGAALWKGKTCRRSLDVVFCMLTFGHRLDPKQAVPYLRLTLLQHECGACHGGWDVYLQ